MTKRGLAILIPIIALTTFLSRPKTAPAQYLKTPPIEKQTPVEEAAKEVTISTYPDTVVQGDPVLVVINGLSGTTTVRSLHFHNTVSKVFLENGKPEALIGLDLRLPSASYPIILTLSDGRVIQRELMVGERTIAKAPLGIPDSLGGNTATSAQELASSLVKESELINSIPTGDEKLWNGYFNYPLKTPIVVTDIYGYTRETSGSTFSHKGTDFRATVGTPVYAMNTGTIAYTGYLRNYGNAIVIDHGLGLQTIYMHLSEINVTKGGKVNKGDLIGKSGDTGYVLGPHLHLSVKIDHISIDPEKFMKLLGS